MALRRLPLLAATALLVASVPATAQADHPVLATATVKLTMGDRARECIGGRCGFFGSRKATIEWTTSCATPPDSERIVEVALMARGKKPGSKPSTVEAAAELDPNGRIEVVVPPGLRAFARVQVDCAYSTPSADGESSVDHKGTAVADSQDETLPPALTGFRFTSNSFCGITVPNRYVDKRAQAGQQSTLAYGLRFSAFSLLGSSSRRALAAGIRLHGSGAGIRFKHKPGTGSSIRTSGGGTQTYIRPRRGGTLKIWATIGGMRTNTLKIKVYPKRGC